MGARGPLKLPKQLRAVTDGEVSGTVAETASRRAPDKTAAVIASDTLSALWDVVVPELDEAGMLSPADGPTIEIALRHYVLAGKAFDEVVEMGTVTVDDHHMAGGIKKHPAEAVFRSESDMFLRYVKELGMSFVSRARTPAAEVRASGGDNPFSAKAI